MFRGDYLKKLRKEKGLSQATVGQAVGVSGAAIGSYERSTITPPMQQVAKLADFFGVPTSDFWTDTDRGNSVKTASQGDVLRVFRALCDLARERKGWHIHMEDLRALDKPLTFTITYTPTNEQAQAATQSLYALFSMAGSGAGAKVEDIPADWGGIIDAWMDRNLPELDKIPLTGAEPPAGEE